VKAGILLRLSEEKDTEQQTQEAFERFERACRSLCAQRGWTVVEVYNEGVVSAYKAGRKRDTFERAMRALEDKTVNVLVVPHVDRFCRGYAEPARAEAAMNKSGGDIVDSTGRSARDDDSWHVLVGVAIAESKRTARRVKAQQEQAAQKGRSPHGGVRLYGYTKKRTAIIEEEAAVIRRAADMILHGKSLYSVTTWANTVSVSPKGGPWQQASFRRMLLSPGLTKLREYHGETFEGTWEAPAILDRQTWEWLRVLLTDPNRVSKAGRPGRFLLSSLAVCFRCQQPLVSHYRPKHRGGAREYFCLGQPGTKRCGKLAVVAEALEDVVEEQVLQELAEGRLVKALAADTASTALLAEREVLRRKLEEVGELYDADEIDKGEWLRRRAKLLPRIAEVQASIDRAAQRSVLSDLPTTEAALREWWQNTATLDQQRAVLKVCLTAVIVGPGSSRGGPKFDAARIAAPWGCQWRF
jgi:site-specific DNA recombinase